MHKVKIINPHGGVLIWNYNDRMGAGTHSKVNEIDQIFINTTSLISISTNKNKSTPAGTFEFRLAPNYNWVARLTPGSWCVMLMSQDVPLPKLDPDNVGSADSNLVKMLGRIDSVRTVVEVNQETGARQTMYVVTGQDWCSVFDTKLYIDPIVRNNNLEKLTAVGESMRVAFDNFITNWKDDKTNVLPSSSQAVDALIKLWGAPLTNFSKDVGSLSGSPGIQLEQNPIFSSEAQFQIPTKVAQYFRSFGKSLTGSDTSINFSTLISRYDGPLKAYDSYAGDTKEALGFPDPSTYYKVNSFWQMLTDNCNPVLNELVTDMRWSDDGGVELALYKRIKPFINRASIEGQENPEVRDNISKFANVRRISVPLEDVISVNAGTNWRDKINFIEIRPQPQLNDANYENVVKLDCQVIDRPAYERDGFKPLIQSATYMPFNGSEPAPLKCVKWKYLMKEWYFNTHLMLNGSISIIGQNQYIQVGDNIMIDATVLGSGQYNIGQGDKATYLLAHVEGVSHSFSVNAETGGRSFVTTIRFVRGVITDISGKLVGDSSAEGAIDMKAQAIGGGEEKHKGVVYNSTLYDPEHVKGH